MKTTRPKDSWWLPFTCTYQLSSASKLHKMPFLLNHWTTQTTAMRRLAQRAPKKLITKGWRTGASVRCLSWGQEQTLTQLWSDARKRGRWERLHCLQEKKTGKLTLTLLVYSPLVTNSGKFCGLSITEWVFDKQSQLDSKATPPSCHLLRFFYPLLISPDQPPPIPFFSPRQQKKQSSFCLWSALLPHCRDTTLSL